MAELIAGAGAGLLLIGALFLSPFTIILGFVLLILGCFAL